MKKTTFFGIVTAGIAGLALAVVLLPSSSTKPVEWPSGAIVADGPLTHDWGTINIEGGLVNHEFTLRNDSKDPLMIRSAETSCMCTSAIVTLVDGSSSPKFGMHNNRTWDATVAPGEEFTVDVTYDPMAHGPDATGPIKRTVSLFTSAAPDGALALPNPKSVGSTLELNVSADVVKAEDFVAKAAPEAEPEYPNIVGDFAFAETEYDFGVLKQSEGVFSHDFDFVYQGEQDIEITDVVGSCACTTGSVDKTKLSPGDTATLTVEFDANLHEEPEGRFFKTVSLLTSPESAESIEVKVWVEVDLDLGLEAYKLQEHSD